MFKPFFLRLMLITSLLLPLAPASAQDDPLALDTELIDGIATSLLADYQAAGLSLAVVLDGELQYAQGYGVRDAGSGAPVTPDTVFSLGSITKSFTALAIAQQVDAGLLDLDTPIVTYLPDFTLTDPDAANALTLRHLLSNSAGFEPDDIGWYRGDLRTIEDVVTYIGTRAVTSTPGTTYVYNNLGYTLAGYVLQSVVGRPYADIIRDDILAPLGMTSADVGFDAMQQAADHAQPHLLDMRSGPVAIDFFANMDAVAPAGAVVASARDMANYALFQLGDGTFNGQRIVSEALLTEMHTPQVDQYGLGWVITDHAGVDLVLHNGSIDGFGAMLVLVPAENLGVVAMMNSDYLDNPGLLDGLALRIVEIALGITTPVDTITALQADIGFYPQERAERIAQAAAFTPDPATYAAYVGEYSSFVGPMAMELRGDALWLLVTQSGLPMEFELVEYAPGEFLANGRGLATSVLRIEPGRRSTIRLFQNGLPIGEKPQ